MFNIKCNNCGNKFAIIDLVTYMCKRCHHFDNYKTGEERKCKKCRGELMFPKLEFITCQKCKKIGTYEIDDELDFIE